MYLDKYNEQFAEVHKYVKKKFFNNRKEFGESIADTLHRHGYIVCPCCCEEQLEYIQKMLNYANIPFEIEKTTFRGKDDYKFVIV